MNTEDVPAATVSTKCYSETNLLFTKNTAANEVVFFE